MRKDFKRKTVVITGATGGIGRSLALRFANGGARVALLDLDPLQLSSLKAQLHNLGADAIGLQCDITDPEQCKATMQRIVSEFGGIDVLINNAGITHRSEFLDTSLDVFNKVMNVNFFGSLHATQAALPHLIERRGLIITMSSIAGFTPQWGKSAYSASKHALHGLFESLRAEIKSTGVQVMMVCPGFTATDLNKNALQGDGSVAEEPLSIVGRVAAPVDVADKIYKGAIAGRKLLILSNVNRISRFLSLLFPRVFQQLMDKKIKAQEG